MGGYGQGGNLGAWDFRGMGRGPPERAEKHLEMFRLVQNIRDGMTTTEIIDDNPAMASCP